MMIDLKRLFEKYKDIIPYAVFGALTTALNVVSFWFIAHVVNLPTTPSTIIAWILAVLFAYFTNRKWVFHSKAHTRKRIVKEIVSFFTCRLITGFVDWACMFIFVKLMSFNDVVIKFTADVLVIIFNYIASKLFIFKMGNSKDGKGEDI